MKANLIRKEYLIYICFLTVILLMTVYSTRKSDLLFDLIHDHIAQQAQDIESIKVDINSKKQPLMILREEFKFVFPDPSAPATHENSYHHRAKRDEPGFLEAEAISAHNIKTDKMFAKHVRADIVKAERVNAVVISVGKAFSVTKATYPSGETDNTLILNRNGPDPSDTTVTIVLERNNDPVSINGHPFHEKEKHELLKLKNDLNNNDKNGNRRPRNRPNRNFNMPDSRSNENLNMPDSRSNQNRIMPSLNPSPPERRETAIMKPNFLRGRNGRLTDLDRKKLIMFNWRKQLVDYKKNRETNKKADISEPDISKTFVSKKDVVNPISSAATRTVNSPRDIKSAKKSLISSQEFAFDDSTESESDFIDSFENDFDSDKQTFRKAKNQRLKTFERKKGWFDDDSDDIYYEDENNSYDFKESSDERETYDENSDDEYEYDEDEQMGGAKNRKNHRSTIGNDFLSSDEGSYEYEFYSSETSNSPESMEKGGNSKLTKHSENLKNTDIVESPDPLGVDSSETERNFGFIQNPQNMESTGLIRNSVKIQTMTSENNPSLTHNLFSNLNMDSKPVIIEPENGRNSEYYSDDLTEYPVKTDVNNNLNRPPDTNSGENKVERVNVHNVQLTNKNNTKNTYGAKKAQAKTADKFFSESAEEWFDDSDFFSREFTT